MSLEQTLMIVQRPRVGFLKGYEDNSITKLEEDFLTFTQEELDRSPDVYRDLLPYTESVEVFVKETDYEACLRAHGASAGFKYSIVRSNGFDVTYEFAETGEKVTIPWSDFDDFSQMVPMKAYACHVTDLEEWHGDYELSNKLGEAYKRATGHELSSCVYAKCTDEMLRLIARRDFDSRLCDADGDEVDDSMYSEMEYKEEVWLAKAAYRQSDPDDDFALFYEEG